MRACPILMPKIGATSSASMSVATPAATQRILTTPRAQADQPREGLSSCRIRGQSTRGPMPPSRAGSSVHTTRVLTTGMSMPPMPMLRSSGTGITSNAHRLIATVPALATTACPAYFIAITTASWLSRPCARSSRHRLTSSRA